MDLRLVVIRSEYFYDLTAKMKKRLPEVVQVASKNGLPASQIPGLSSADRLFYLERATRYYENRPQTITLLERATKDPDFKVRLFAMQSLGRDLAPHAKSVLISGTDEGLSTIISLIKKRQVSQGYQLLFLFVEMRILVSHCARLWTIRLRRGRYARPQYPRSRP